MKVWSLDTMKCTHTITDHDNTVCKLVISHNALFSGSYAVIKVHSLDNFACVHTIRGHTHWVRALCVGPSGYLYAGSHNTIKVLSLKSLQWVKSISAKFGKSCGDGILFIQSF